MDARAKNIPTVGTIIKLVKLPDNGETPNLNRRVVKADEILFGVRIKIIRRRTDGKTKTDH